jgi:mannose-6-phosphate isomerase-like protein (cupin superfamily)
MSERTVYHFEEQEWHVPIAAGNDEQDSIEAGRKGAKRRFLAQGDSGFFVQVVEIPPNFDAPAHSHNHAEVFMVLEGSVIVDGETLGPYDMTVVPENGVYGFTSGPEGVRFLVVRTGKASFAGAGAGAATAAAATSAAATSATNGAVQ